jgi:RNA polymerase sigma factor (sigma-70 family)
MALELPREECLMSPTVIALHHHVTDDYLRTSQAERVERASRPRLPAKGWGLDGLVARAATRDEFAWAELVRRFEPHLLRVARSHGLSLHEAEDAVQDTWLRLMHGIDGVREPYALGGWLTTTARRESLRLRERGSHELPTADDLGGEVTTGDEAEAQLDLAACRAAVTRALDSLPPRHRLLMRALFDEAAGSYHEIARELGIPAGSIGPIRGRCLEQLRRNAHLRRVAEAFE